MTAAKKDGLELNEDRPFQEKVWVVQRGAWVAMALIMLVALAGFTGQGGPLASATASSPEGKVTYPRVARWETNDSLTIALAPAAGTEATVDLGVGFSDVFEIVDIQPQPAESSVTRDGQRLVFQSEGPPGERQVTVHVRPAKPSLVNRLDVRLNDGRPLTLTPVVLP